VRVLAGEAVDRGGTGWVEGARSGVVAVGRRRGVEHVWAEAEGLHRAFAAGESMPAEVVLDMVDALTEADLAMIAAAQPFGETVNRLLDTGQQDSIQTFCAE